MRRSALAAVALLALGSCSWLFNPDHVKFESCEALPTPAPLDAIAGDRTGLTFEWPNLRGEDGGTFKDWQLCWGFSDSSLGTCRTFTNTGCEGATCAFSVDGIDAGFEYNRRVYAQVVSRDRCGKQSEPAVTSTTPINGTFLDLDGIQLSTECDAGTVADAGILTFAQTPMGFSCISALAMGDENWRDSTIDVEVRSSGGTYAGVVFHYPELAGAIGPRRAAVWTPSVGAIYSLMLTRKVQGGGDLPVATSIPLFQDGVWYAMRVSTVGTRVSVAVGAIGSPLQEVLRWREASTTGTQNGRLGLALVSTLGQPARADMRKLRARSAGTVPDGGATSLSLTFGGAGGLDKVRLVPPSDNRARVAQCPNGFSAACATCSPAGGSQCLELNSGLIANASATFDVPVGIDFDRPWSLKFKFAPVLVDNPNEPIVVRATAGDFATRPIISGSGPNWTMLKGFENDALGSINRAEWNRFELVFDTKNGLYSVAINGHAALDAGVIPATLDPHLGAFVFGGDGLLVHAEHGFWTDVEISQP